MADNLSVSQGSGALLLTDETTVGAATGQVQRVTLGAGQNLSCLNVPISSASTPGALFAINKAAKERMFQPIDGDIYVGPSNVTSGTGFKIPSGTIIGTNAISAIYVLAVGTGTVNVRTWEVT